MPQLLPCHYILLTKTRPKNVNLFCQNPTYLLQLSKTSEVSSAISSENF